MPLFSYEARNSSGEKISATLEADHQKAAAMKLQAAGLFPVSITLCKTAHWKEKLAYISFKKVTHKDICVFTRRLADSLRGGLPIARAIGVLKNQTENKELAGITRDIETLLQDGQPLSGALKNFPDVFPSIYIAMITAGETAGVLDTVLDRIADFLDKEEELRYRIQSALAYPLMLLAVGCASVLFLLGFVIPKFELMFQDLGQAMPLPTQILISISHIVRYWWWAYMPIALVAAVSIFRWYSTRTGKLFFSNAKLKLPVIGGFLRKDMVAKFLRMLSILLTNGVPILDALSIARNSIDNLLFSNDIDRICAAVEDGQGLSASIAQSTLFPSMVYEMIAVGEETGKMESSLSRVADMYEREVEYAIKTMTSLLEPAIILFAGIIVCLIALSMLLPVFQVSAGIR